MQLQGTQRSEFMVNVGRQYGDTSHYREAGEGFKALKNFKPFASLDISNADYPHFYQGFRETQDLRLLAQLTAHKARMDNTNILAELEGKGLTFLQERVEFKEVMESLK